MWLWNTAQREYRVFFPGEGATERLRMTPLGHSLYRVEETAASEEPVFYHDVIEATMRLGRGLRFRRVARRSGLRVFRFLLSREFLEAAPMRAFLKRVSAHGGHWETLFGGLLLVHLPRGSACRPKSELRAITAGLPREGEEGRA